ncbi:hypothetical protein EDC01DRAFT_638433 [Geopyxis carbonaria]|nr:hypothetical protein EDC01DRAFT_638433 [Geopyxis carbonaria]
MTTLSPSTIESYADILADITRGNVQIKVQMAELAAAAKPHSIEINVLANRLRRMEQLERELISSFDLPYPSDSEVQKVIKELEKTDDVAITEAETRLMSALSEKFRPPSAFGVTAEDKLVLLQDKMEACQSENHNLRLSRFKLKEALCQKTFDGRLAEILFEELKAQNYRIARRITSALGLRAADYIEQTEQGTNLAELVYMMVADHRIDKERSKGMKAELEAKNAEIKVLKKRVNHLAQSHAI